MATVNELTSRAIQTLVDAYNSTTKYLQHPIYNVMGFGAKGDGVTDDIDAIQAAIDEAYNNGGGIVCAPNESFLITRPIILKNQVRLIGSGMRSTIIKQTGIGPVIQIDPACDVQMYGVEVSNMKLHCNQADTATGDGIYCKTKWGFNNSIFKNLWIYKPGRNGFRFEQDATNVWYAWSQYLEFENIQIGDGYSSLDGSLDYAFYVAGGFSTNKFVNVRTYSCKKGFYFNSFNHPTNGFMYPEALTFDTCNIQNINGSADSVEHGVYLRDVYSATFLNSYVEGISPNDSTKTSSAIFVDGGTRNVRVVGGLIAGTHIGANFNSGAGGKVEGVTFLFKGDAPYTAPTCIVMGANFTVYSLELGGNQLASTGFTPTYLNDNNRSVGFRDLVGTFNTRQVQAGKASVGGDWQYGWFAMGNNYLWRDSSANMRFKNGTPTNDTDGFVLNAGRTGTTAQRPTAGLYISMPYFDTTLNKPVWCKTTSPAAWVDATGAVV